MLPPAASPFFPLIATAMLHRAPMSDRSAFPLAWPASRPRLAATQRQPARFTRDAAPLSVLAGLTRLREELARLEARYVVISTNVAMRADGLPRTERVPPRDPGAAAYFQIEGRPYCIACDSWDRVPDNLAAIAAHVEATRRLLRFGVQSLAEALNTFATLPVEPAPVARNWRSVLGFKRSDRPTLESVEAIYRALARAHHPDIGGSDDAMAELNRAVAAARQDLAAR
jgi:hypothetical protein